MRKCHPRQLINTVSRYLLSSHCVICQRTSSLNPCQLCRAQLPRIANHCVVCARSIAKGQTHCGRCFNSSHAYHSILVPYTYLPPISTMIKRLKFNRQLHFADIIGQLLANYLISQHDHAWPEVIIPVPLHPHRQRYRGFNQANEIAKSIATALNLPIDNGLVQRVLATKPQSQIAAKYRTHNMNSAFRLTNNHSYQHIVIIDDVVTTGATINEVSRLFYRDHCRVDIWAVARTI